MIKVLIVDDERKVREGIKAMIPWESCGFAVVGTASNGFEALDKYEESKPELVVADIRMPGMDGLQLIQALRERDDKLRFLILSGYADFEYAKQAIAHRADGYLLKPVDEEEMVASLKKIREDHRQEQEKRQWDRLAEKWTRNIFVQSLLTEPGNEAKFSLEQKAESLGLKAKEYQVMLVSIHARPGDALHTGILEEAEQLIADYFERSGRGVSFTVHSQTGIVLNTAVVGEQMRKRLYGEIMSALEGKAVQVTVVFGPLVHSLGEVHLSYETAKDMLKHEFFISDCGVLSADNEWPLPFPDEPAAAPEHLEDRLYYAMDLGDKEAIEALIRSSGEWMAGTGASEADIKRFFAELASSLLTRLSLNDPALGSGLKEFADRIALIYQQRNLQAMYRHIGELLNSAMEPLGIRTKEHDMKALLDLIQRHFSDNLKLETLAGVFNYNTAYLGKMFKNATGEYFNTYLDKVRIEHAKQYLQQGMKVYQVAEKVGYMNVDYFHSKFRKYVGTSPSSYRKNGNPLDDGEIST